MAPKMPPVEDEGETQVSEQRPCQCAEPIGSPKPMAHHPGVPSDPRQIHRCNLKCIDRERTSKPALDLGEVVARADSLDYDHRHAQAHHAEHNHNSLMRHHGSSSAIQKRSPNEDHLTNR